MPPVQVRATEPHEQTVTFDLRTWTVDDLQPDDPQPAPGAPATGH
jgi:hypothetical protein